MAGEHVGVRPQASPREGLAHEECTHMRCALQESWLQCLQRKPPTPVQPIGPEVYTTEAAPGDPTYLDVHELVVRQPLHSKHLLRHFHLLPLMAPVTEDWFGTRIATLSLP